MEALYGILMLLLPISTTGELYNMQCLPGYQELSSAPGVMLCQKQGENTFIQMVDLSQGAKLNLMHNEITSTQEPEGTFGIPNPEIDRKDILDIWSEDFEWQENAFSLFNGSHFESWVFDTKLSYPIIINSELISGGNKPSIEFNADGLRMLELWDGHARIRDVQISPVVPILSQTSAPNVIIGENGNAEPDPVEESTGRTMIGVAGEKNEILIAVVTESKTIAEGSRILLDYGVSHTPDDPYGKRSQIIRLDGSGSSQLINRGCANSHCISTGRNLPQTIGIISGANKPCERLNEPIPTPTVSSKFKMYGNLGYISYYGDNLFLTVDPENTGFEVMGKISSLSSHLARDFYVGGTKAYLALGFEGMDILDISENCSPKIIQHLDLDETSLAEGEYFRNVHVDPRNASYAYIGGKKGIFVVNLHLNEGQPVVLYKLNTIDFPKIEISGNFLYALGSTKLEIYNIENALQIQKVGEFINAGVLNYLDIFVRKGKAYLFDWYNQRVDVVDISSLNNIEKVDELSFTATERDYFSFTTEKESLWIAGHNVLYGYDMDSRQLLFYQETQATDPEGVGKIGNNIFIFDSKLGMIKVSIQE